VGILGLLAIFMPMPSQIKLYQSFLCCFLFLGCFNLKSQDVKDTLRVAYTQAPPFIIQENGLLEGINIWLWKRVAKDLELEYELIPMEFSQMLDSLKRGKVDLSINPLTISGDRSKSMEFTHSFFASHSTIAVAEQSSLQRVKQFFFFILIF